MMAPRYWDLSVLRHENGGGAVRRADDGDGGSVLQVKAQKPARNRVKKMPNCAAAPKSISHGFASSGPKSIIAPMPMNSSSGNSSLDDARFKQRRDGGLRVSPCVMAPGQRQVDQNGTKAHGQQQARLHLFGDGKVDEQCTDAPHHHHLPGQVPKIGKQTGECVQKSIVYFSSYCAPVPVTRKRDSCHSTSVCDKSLKPTHDIGHFCRDDAAMQQSPAGPAGTLPFTPFYRF